MAWMTNHYTCAACGHVWDDEWSCAVDDECPICGADISPEDSTDLTVRVERAYSGDGYVVKVSSPEANDRPRYAIHPFTNKWSADAFAKTTRALQEAA